MRTHSASKRLEALEAAQTSTAVAVEDAGTPETGKALTQGSAKGSKEANKEISRLARGRAIKKAAKNKSNDNSTAAGSKTVDAIKISNAINTSNQAPIRSSPPTNGPESGSNTTNAVKTATTAVKHEKKSATEPSPDINNVQSLGNTASLKKALLACEGNPTGEGTSSVAPIGAETTEPWACANLMCSTGMTYMTGSTYKRRAISDHFGRNKKQAKEIPPHVWQTFCRKCYQHMHDSKSKSKKQMFEWKMGCMIEQLTRFSAWRPDIRFTAQMSRAVLQRSELYKSLLKQNNNDADAAMKAYTAPGQPGAVSDKLNSKGNPRPPTITGQFPIALVDEFVSDCCPAGLLDADSVKTILKKINDYFDDGKIQSMPPIEFILCAPEQDHDVDKGVSIKSIKSDKAEEAAYPQEPGENEEPSGISTSTAFTAVNSASGNQDPSKPNKSVTRNKRPMTDDGERVDGESKDKELWLVAEPSLPLPKEQDPAKDLKGKKTLKRKDLSVTKDNVKAQAGVLQDKKTRKHTDRGKDLAGVPDDEKTRDLKDRGEGTIKDLNAKGTRKRKSLDEGPAEGPSDEKTPDCKDHHDGPVEEQNDEKARKRKDRNVSFDPYSDNEKARKCQKKD
ncbi:hypothetical protein K470DRAFT_269460 [Piedraia hortae CBS 480.64]|uniref:Uncharacterized protein n=1 Tax=Piedraia hortae CBS 480.64 TaxID=1314780 RepID=A0A6A7C3K0_9PEZI|nr:hypothetical protein K470DRAFT_269460 [Piedraia hortae CBS 480.64]